MFEIYNEARRHRDDPNLDHREYLASKNLSEQHLQLLIGQLEPIQSEEIISTSLSQNCRGIYSHYLTHLKTKLGDHAPFNERPVLSRPVPVVKIRLPSKTTTHLKTVRKIFLLTLSHYSQKTKNQQKDFQK